VVEARCVRKDRSTLAHFHAVRLEDADEGGIGSYSSRVLLKNPLALSPLHHIMDLRWPVPRVLSVAGMQREVDLSLGWSQVRKGLLDIGEQVVANGNDEQRIFS
jgi:hypothetical protein